MRIINHVCLSGLPMYAGGKKGWNSIENCFRKFRKKYTDGGMCLNIVSIVYFTLYFSIKYITQIALDKNNTWEKAWSKLNTKRKLDLVHPLQVNLQWHQWHWGPMIWVIISDKLITMAARRHKEAIHSGHFMVSNFEADEQDEDDIVGIPVPSEDSTAEKVPDAAVQQKVQNQFK